MKTNLLCRKKSNKTCSTLLLFAAIGGTCALIAWHLKKQRKLLHPKICSEAPHQNNTASQNSSKPTSTTYQTVVQNKPISENTELNANSSEWERNIS